ncbi:MAG: hypothetical protein PHF86_06805 [Candidatus Nanoarchaeia archaeon]|jgi:hypothetical protein|nr:hypothetical protein [Candidatus Nanoarchaeia archaeon]
MKKDLIYVTTCENCIHSDFCCILNSYTCNNFIPTIDSNYRYVLDPNLFEIEKQNFALYLL